MPEINIFDRTLKIIARDNAKVFRKSIQKWKNKKSFLT